VQFAQAGMFARREFVTGISSCLIKTTHRGNIPVWVFPLYSFKGGNMFKFYLSGFGHLTEMKSIPEGMSIKINVLSESSDNIELECIVSKPDLVEHLDNLRLACRVEECVVLQFIAYYTKFSYCHAGLTEQDPKQIVQLQGRLMSVEGWLRSIHLPPATSPDDI
jgi:hypothetical protein